MRHVQYTPADSQFWDWTWDELARFDLPAVTAKILEVTNSTSIGYVGHSQGCTIALAALSSNFGGIRSRINAFVGLAPVAYLANCPSPLLTGLAQLQLDTILRILGIKEFIPSGTILDKIVPGFCKLFPDACKAAICLLAGCTDNNISPAALNFAMSHFPAPTSVLNMAHWSQLLRSKQFQMFDYGSSDKNKEHYGVSTPPNYYIGNVTCGPSTKCPIGIFYGANDILADKKDVETYLIPKLQSGNGVSLAKVMLFNNYGHTDFIWGQDTSARVYTPYVATLLKQAAAAAGN
jgi:pimeloyl-ACP methyl ester carboxylesterase